MVDNPFAVRHSHAIYNTGWASHIKSENSKLPFFSATSFPVIIYAPVFLDFHYLFSKKKKKIKK